MQRTLSHRANDQLETNMEREFTLGELTELTGVAPRNAGLFLAEYLTRQNMSENQAAKKIGCATSTINRLVKGADLTAEMAAKIHQAFGLSVQMLFNIEAGYKTYQAEKLLHHGKVA